MNDEVVANSNAGKFNVGNGNQGESYSSVLALNCSTLLTKVFQASFRERYMSKCLFARVSQGLSSFLASPENGCLWFSPTQNLRKQQCSLLG